MHPYLQEWLSHGQSVAGKLPRGAIVELESAQLWPIAPALSPRPRRSLTRQKSPTPEPIAPPIRFGGDLTFLGYEPNVQRTFMPGETVNVITYWRAEGELVPDLLLFHHLLSDPISPVYIHDVIGVNPTLMQGRDVFIQVTPIDLHEGALPGEYFVSVGAYRPGSNDERLPVLKDDQPHGDRIFLYDIQVLPSTSSDESGA